MLWTSLTEEVGIPFQSACLTLSLHHLFLQVAHQILRSFLASRVFLVGLKEGMDFAAQMKKLRLGDGCLDAFTKMTQCSVCSGVPRSVKPCKKWVLLLRRWTYDLDVEGGIRRGCAIPDSWKSFPRINCNSQHSHSAKQHIPVFLIEDVNPGFSFCSGKGLLFLFLEKSSIIPELLDPLVPPP